MPATEAFEAILAIIKANVEIHVLENAQVYSRKSLRENPGQKWILLGELERAYRENCVRRDRSCDNTRRSKDAAPEHNAPPSGRAPG